MAKREQRNHKLGKVAKQN
jgi:hypothetical protein